MNTLTESFRKITLKDDDLFTIIRMASKKGEIDIIEKLSKDFIFDNELDNKTNCILAEDGHRELITFFSDDVAFHAAKGGYTPIVNDAISAGYDNYKVIINGAAEGGHLETVLSMIEEGIHGYYDMDDIAFSAAKGGHIYIVEEMIRRGANNFIDIVLRAKKYHHHELLRYMKECNHTQEKCKLCGRC